MTTAAAPIEIFRPGTFTPMVGEPLTFSEADLMACAAGYDPAKHEAPLCVGHPAHNLPAYGWVRSVRFAQDDAGGALVVDPTQVDPAFAEMVRAGRFKKISAAFFKPDSPGNPTPGTFYLRHVGFLGAQPPAVKGLKPVAFAADQDGVVVFGAGETGRRGLLRQAFGLLAAAFGEGEPEPAVPPATTPATLPTPPAPLPTPLKEVTPTMPPDDVKKREADLAAREAAFAERDRAARRRDNAAFLETILAAGKAPALGQAERKARTLAFMDRLDAAEVVAFAEGDGGKATELDEFKALLSALPVSVDFSERAKAEAADAQTAAFAAPAGYVVDPAGAVLHAKAQAHQSKNPGVGYLEAVKAVGGR